MKLNLVSTLALALISTAFFMSGPISATSEYTAIDPILQSLLEFHPAWITRSVTSHDGKGGNDDGSWNGNSPETIDGVQYQTLFHGKGEGRIVRFWMTADLLNEVPNDYQELRIEIDGKTFYRGRPLDFFNGLGSWTSPVVMGYNETSGAFLSYLPMPYSADAKILFRGVPHYFQVTYREGTGSFSGPSHDQISKFMSDRSWAAQLAAQPVSNLQMSQVIATGPATISGLKINCTEAQLLDLRVRVGNLQPVPAAFFFGLGTSGSVLPGKALAEVHSELNDVAIQNNKIQLMTRLPIPLATGETLVFESATNPHEIISYAVENAMTLYPSVHLDMQFHNQVGPGTPTTMAFYESTTATQFVSLVEQITGNPPGNRRYLEGDEMIRMDQMVYPLQLGTGMEDYFNGGWYFAMGPFTNPNSGEPRFNVINPGDDWSQANFEHSLYRHHVLDPIVARTGMRFGFETGDIGDFSPIEHQTLATAYQFDSLQASGAPQIFVGGDQAQNLNSRFDAEFNQPPLQMNIFTSRKAKVLNVTCPANAKSVLLTRTYDAGVPLVAADISVNGRKQGVLYEAYSNPARRFAQDEIWLDLKTDDCKNSLKLTITPTVKSRPSWNASNYQVRFFQ